MALRSAEKWARDLLSARSGGLDNSKLGTLRRRGPEFCHQVQSILLRRCSSNPSGLRGRDTDIISLLGGLGYPSQALLDHLDRMLELGEPRSFIFHSSCWGALTNMIRYLDQAQRERYAEKARQECEEAEHQGYVGPCAIFLNSLAFLESQGS